MTGNDASNALLDSTRTEAIMRLMDRGEDRETIEREIAALETDLYQANRELAEANAECRGHRLAIEELERRLSEAQLDRDEARADRDSHQREAIRSMEYAERLLDLLRRLYADHMEVEAASGFGIAPLIKREVEAVLAKNPAPVAGAIGTSQATVASTEHAEASGPGPQTPLEIGEICDACKGPLYRLVVLHCPACDSHYAGPKEMRENAAAARAARADGNVGLSAALTEFFKFGGDYSLLVGSAGIPNSVRERIPMIAQESFMSGWDACAKVPSFSADAPTTAPCNEQCEPNGCASCPLDERTSQGRDR